MPQPTPADLAEGAAYVIRTNRRDITNVLIYVGVLGAVAIGCFLIVHAFGGYHPPAGTCTSVQACNHYIQTHPVHVKTPPGVQIYKPLAGNSP